MSLVEARDIIVSNLDIFQIDDLTIKFYLNMLTKYQL